MTQNQPQKVTYNGLRARERSPTGENRGSDGPVGSGVQGRLGLQKRVGAVKGQKWPILGLKTVSRRDVRGHVAT